MAKVKLTTRLKKWAPAFFAGAAALWAWGKFGGGASSAMSKITSYATGRA